MSRLFKFILFSLVVVFTLACALITNPINKVKDTANTAQAFATDAASLGTQAAPFQTMLANPSLIPDVGNFFNPQGAPVAEWNGIPVMPQATAGQEFDQHNYSFKFSGVPKDVEDFYNAELAKLGWTATFSMPITDQGGLLSFSKENNALTITITVMEEGTTVVLFTYV